MSKIIVTGDWHIRSDVPICRKDIDWLYTQKQVIEFIFGYAEEQGINTIVHTGDLFHRGNSHSSVVSMLARILSKRIVENDNLKFLMIAGNHDLPYHNIRNKFVSSFGAIYSFVDRKQNFIDLFDFGMEKDAKKTKKIIAIHRLTYEKNKPQYIEDASTAQELLEEFPDANIICVGDNHSNFIYSEKGRHVVNPGCITIQNAEKKNYSPGFWVVDTKDNSFEFVLVPNDENNITDLHTVQKKERKNRISAFVESLMGSDVGLNLDFVSVLEKIVQKEGKEMQKELQKIKNNV